MRGLHKLLAFVALTAVLVVSCPPVAALAAPKFVAPVDAAVSREFDLSNGEFAAGGHRGIDYSVPEGTLVRASGPGVVSFAGSTPEGPYVSITHDGGVKTTYSLGEISVSAGQEVGRGTIIGTSGAGHDNGGPLLHFGALIDGKYIDPLLLLGDFEDITDLLSLAEIQGSLAPAGSRLASAVTLPEFGAGFAPPDLAPFDPGAGFAPFGPGTAPDVAPIPPNFRPEIVPIPPQPEQLQIGPSGPPTLRGPPLPSRFYRDDFTGEGGAGDGPRFDPRTGLPLFNAPKLVEDWWIGLTEAERRALIERYPVEIGHLVGVPVDARDQANRLALSNRIKELEAMKRERDKLLRGFPEARSLMDHRTWLSKAYPTLAGYYESFVGLTPWRRRMTALSRELAGAKNLQRQLDEIAKDPRNRLHPSDVYLMELDTNAGFGDGQAVVAFGNPTVAEHVGVVVPGINNSLLDVENPMEDAAVLRSRVAHNEDINSMNRTSAITWLGYDTPNGLLDATNKAEAREGAPRLDRFVDGLRASHARPAIRRGYADRRFRDPRITGFGHSYGSVVAGMARKRGMDTDDLALLAGPGGGVLYGSELTGIDRGVWATRTPDDPIRWVSPWDFKLAPKVLGQDPMDSDFGAAHIPLDGDQNGHGDYYERGSKGLDNMAWLLTGRYENIEEEIDA